MEMSRRRVLTSLAFGALAVKTTGCFGSFQLTRNVWEFNRNISGDKFVQWLMFLVLSIIPVYAVAAFIDAIVLNSIEFWTGKNPMAAAAGDEADRRVVQLDGEHTLELVREQQGELLRVVLSRAGQAPLVRTFHFHPDALLVHDGSGELLAEARTDATGGVTVRSGGEVLAHYSAAQVRSAEEAWARGGAAQLAVAARQAALQAGGACVAAR